MAAYTEGLLSGILASNQLLAEIPPTGTETGPIPIFWLSASVAATVEVQVRDSANTSTLWAHRFNMSAAAPICTPPPCGQIVLEANERLRVMLVSSIVGAVQATIIA